MKRAVRKSIAKKTRAAPPRIFLAVDIGNTNITLGVFRGPALLATARAQTCRRTVDEADVLMTALLHQKGISISSVSQAAVASVVPDVSPNVNLAVLRHCPFLLDVNDLAVREMIAVDYRPPASVGADRLANAIAAHELYRNSQSKIVVDFGTATTFDCISPAGTYLGGAIHPGVEISAQSLFEKTAQLPQIDFSPQKRAVGKDTQSSIRAGLFFGIVGAVREIAQQLEKEIGPAYRIGTGGLAPAVCPSVGGFDAVDVDLTLKGIKLLFDKFLASRAPRT